MRVKKWKPDYQYSHIFYISPQLTIVGDNWIFSVGDYKNGVKIFKFSEKNQKYMRFDFMKEKYPDFFCCKLFHLERHKVVILVDCKRSKMIWVLSYDEGSSSDLKMLSVFKGMKFTNSW